MNASAPASHAQDGLVLALSGGIGGAKLALGLSRILPPGELVVVANTGDDFEHLGLSISPDLDTLLYTLAGIDNPETGWGLRSETWTFMAALGALGGETWFQLGDGDLATHVERTRRLKAGEPLSRITDDFRRRLGVRTKILPMTDDEVRTRVRTSEGWLEFQDYFVRRRCEPAVAELAYEGAAAARAHGEFLAALADARLRAIVVTAKMMVELGLPVAAAAVARHYGDLLDGYLVDHSDAGTVTCSGLEVANAATMMTTLADREALAREVLAFADSLRRSRAEPAVAPA